MRTSLGDFNGRWPRTYIEPVNLGTDRSLRIHDQLSIQSFFLRNYATQRSFMRLLK